MATQSLLVWIVLYASLFAVSGFSAVILRGVTGREWSNRTILRVCSGLSFIGSATIWLLLIALG